MTSIPFRGRNYLWVNEPLVEKETIENSSWKKEWGHEPPGNEPVVHKLGEIGHRPPGDLPEVHKEDYAAQLAPEEPTPPPICIPVAFGGGGFLVIPLKDPYEIGDLITISLTSPPTGTAPINYQWLINGSPRDTAETFLYTVLKADVQGTVGDIGFIEISLVLTNPCGTVTSAVLTINVFNPP